MAGFQVSINGRFWVSPEVQILKDRSGSMYDTKVVETFIRIHKVIAPTKDDLSGKRAIGEIMASELEKSEQAARELAAPETSGSELQLLSDLAAELASVSTLYQAGETISRHLRELTPASMCVFYMYEDESDELVARHVSGTNWQKVIGTRIPIGLRLTGWVWSRQKDHSQLRSCAGSWRTSQTAAARASQLPEHTPVSRLAAGGCIDALRAGSRRVQ